MIAQGFLEAFMWVTLGLYLYIIQLKRLFKHAL